MKRTTEEKKPKLPLKIREKKLTFGWCWVLENEVNTKGLNNNTFIWCIHGVVLRKRKRRRDAQVVELPVTYTEVVLEMSQDPLKSAVI